MKRIGKMIAVLALVLIALALVIALVGWIGLKVTPDPLPAYPADTTLDQTVPLPDDLPAPVARFYRAVAGESIPVIESAVLTGPAKMRFGGITFPARYRFIHEAGQNYRHYIELTLFGQTLMKVNEFYLDGNSRLELPFGTVENEPKVNQAANLGLWGESMALPSIFLTDPRVRWEAIDDTTARLVVPFEDGEDSFTVHFDPDTGLLTTMEAMRYKDKDGEKIRWICEASEWGSFHGLTLPRVMSVTWEDEGTPWVVFTVEDLVFNADVSEAIRRHGP